MLWTNNTCIISTLKIFGYIRSNLSHIIVKEIEKKKICTIVK